MGKMTYTQLQEIVKESIDELNTSTGVGGYNTPKAFKPQGPYLTSVSRPKRPSHTKMFDFLEEKEK